MNSNFKIYAFLSLFIAAFTFAANISATAQEREVRNTSAVNNRRSAGLVSITNKLAFQIGKDFAMAIEDTKYMKDDNKSFNFAIVDLVYLIDSLEGQAEAVQLQGIMKGIVRGQKDLTLVSKEIAAISTAYQTRIAAEQKWYFSVGTAQMNLMMSGWAKDATATAKFAKELQGLSKTAPASTPKIILDAMNGLSKYATLNPFTVDDYGDMNNDAKIISTLVYA